MLKEAPMIVKMEGEIHVKTKIYNELCLLYIIIITDIIILLLQQLLSLGKSFCIIFGNLPPFGYKSISDVMNNDGH